MASTKHAPDATRPRPKADKIEDLLDREEARAISDVTESIQRVGDDLCAATNLRARIRAHPFGSVGLAFLSGFVVIPFVARSLSAALPIAMAFVGSRRASTGESKTLPRWTGGLPSMLRSALGFEPTKP